MHTHDCIHEHLPRLASQRTPQRYVAPEKAAAAEGGGTAQALRIHVSAESLSSDPGRACFAEGESYSAFEGGDEYTCAVLASGDVMCWGRGGRLGASHSDSVGDGPDEMGDNLVAVPLGTDVAATVVSAYYEHTCAVLTPAR